MAFESMTEAGRKFGSKFRQRKFDSYHGGDQPKESDKPAPARKLDAEPKDSSVPKNKHAEDIDVKKPSESQEERHVAHVHYAHDHENNNHTVTKKYSDGKAETTSHPSAAEAYEAGGTEQATDVKKREHPDQQGAESEERNYEMPDLVI